MAKATAECTCAKCGKTFYKTNICRNRTAADEWQKWAEANCDTCPECWKEEKVANEIGNAAEIVEMHYGEYKSNYADYKTVPGSYDSKSKTVKVIITKKQKCKEEAKPFYIAHGEPADKYDRFFEHLWEAREMLEVTDKMDPEAVEITKLIIKYR